MGDTHRGERGFLRPHVRAPRSDARASPAWTPSPNSRKPRAGAASPGVGGALGASAYVIKKRPRGCSRLVGREVAPDWLAVDSPSYWLIVGALSDAAGRRSNRPTLLRRPKTRGKAPGF